MFRPNFAWRGVAVLGVAALALGACADNEGGEEPSGGGTDFEGTLNVGLILPQTGGLSEYGQGMIAAAEMAIQEVNENGGVWGNDIAYQIRDEGPAEDAEVVQQAADFMISQGVNAVIGAASSTASLNIIEALYNQQIIQISPSNTGPDFTGHPHGKYYFRTAPSDVIQGSALAEEILNDGMQTVGIMAQQTAYGEGLANQIESVVTAGGAEVVAKEFYDLATTEYGATVQQLVDADPDAIVLISYQEALQIIPALVGAGLGPDTKQWYFVDGNRLDYSQEEGFEPGLMEGVKASQPGGESEPTEFYERLDAFRAGLPQRAYTPESYDAVILLALAAIQANTDDPDAIAEAMVAVSKGGTKCTTFAQCRELIENGEDIDYDGISGPIEFTDDGDPGSAQIGIFEYNADNAYERIKTVEGTMEATS
jgi:ABC-type branched-subunit amino acid transport system substrate-binding protein